MRTAKFEDLEEFLFAWFKEVRESKVPLDGKIIKDKAIRITQELYYNGFKASDCWLQKFFTRFHISQHMLFVVN